jgi:hypothetical protein
MLFLALFSSAILLAASYGAIWRSRWWLAGFVGCGILFLFFPPFGGTAFGQSALALQFLGLLIVVGLFSPLPRIHNWLRIGLPILVTVAAYAYCTWIVVREIQEYERLRGIYAFESVEERVPVPRTSPRGAILTAAKSADLIELEDLTDSAVGVAAGRSRRLKTLHANTVDMFLDSPGFGIGRRLDLPSERSLTWGIRENEPVPQPVPRVSPAESADQSSPNTSFKIPDHLRALHQSSIVDFVYPSGAGYVKDRQHVAGFLAHGFSKVPEPRESWSVEAIDLVSLLCHDEPVAYVSANLPRMDEHRGAQAPTRPLDGFESVGLQKLVAGEYLVAAESGSHLRVLGSIRAVNQCLKCHGAERGDLLGAFSYTLRRNGSAAQQP